MVDRTAPHQIVFFDVFGTLLDLDDDPHDPAGLASMTEWLVQRGYACTSEFLDRELTRSKNELLSSTPYPCPDIDVTNAFRSLLNSIAGSDKPISESFVVEAATAFRAFTTRSLSPVEGVVAALRTMSTGLEAHSVGAGTHSAMVHLGIVSNTQRVYTEWELGKFKLYDRFEHVVFSSDVLSCKPCPRPFERALELFGCDGESAIHIGDNLLDDIHGASQLGMRTILIERDDRRTPSSTPTAPSSDLSALRSKQAEPDAVVRASSAERDLPVVVAQLLAR